MDIVESAIWYIICLRLIQTCLLYETTCFSTYTGLDKDSRCWELSSQCRNRCHSGGPYYSRPHQDPRKSTQGANCVQRWNASLTELLFQFLEPLRRAPPWIAGVFLFRLLPREDQQIFRLEFLLRVGLHCKGGQQPRPLPRSLLTHLLGCSAR